MRHLKTHLSAARNYRSFFTEDFTHITIIVYQALELGIDSGADKIIAEGDRLVWTLKGEKLGEDTFQKTPQPIDYIGEIKNILSKDLILSQYLQIASETSGQLEITVLREQPMQTRLILADLNRDLVDTWRAVFSGVEQVAVHHGSIFDVDCDALVSPANSFGFMDGGLDLRISQVFGWHVQEKLQQLIQAKYHGELLVGMADMVETHNSKIPYLISAPTMRVPMILGPSTINVYLAMRAILVFIKHGFAGRTPMGSIVKTVAIPGLGTGVGQVPYDICARQMKTAIDEVLFDKFEFPASWHEAQTRHQHLYSDSPRDLQYPK